MFVHGAIFEKVSVCLRFRGLAPKSKLANEGLPALMGGPAWQRIVTEFTPKADVFHHLHSSNPVPPGLKVLQIDLEAFKMALAVEVSSTKVLQSLHDLVKIEHSRRYCHG